MFLTLAYITQRFAFGRRHDKNPYLKYFTADDFGLTAEKVSPRKGLNGFLYRKDGVEQRKKVIIFCHGMGPGHIAYTTEIAYFCNAGYAVLAIDSTGCNFSEGKKIKGMYSGVETAVSAVKFARSLGYSGIYLVGHSWGGYSALCASAKINVDKTVAISAPDTPSKTMQDAAAVALSKPLAAALRPFWWLIALFKYGAKGNTSAAKSAQKSGVPTLIIHGDKDNTVKLKNSAYAKANGKNVVKFLAGGKAHNPYNTQNAEKLLFELSAKLKKGDRDFSLFDFTAATEEDESVMKEILQFIEND